MRVPEEFLPERDQVDRLAVAALHAGWRAHATPQPARILAPGLAAPALTAERVAAVLALCAREQLDGLAALGLRALGAAEGPLDLSTRVKTAALRSLLVDASRRKVTVALAREGITATFLKGTVADLLWWQGQGLRGTTDLDILIPPTALHTTHEVLQGLGYRYAADPQKPHAERRKPERLYLAKDRHRWLDVDLHLGVMKSPPYVECAPELLERAGAVDTPLGSVQGLSREDMLSHVAGNLAGSKFVGRMKLLLDAACLVADPAIDLHAVAERALRWRCGWALWGLLRLVEVRMGVPVPAPVLRALRPSRAQRLLVEAVVGVWGAPRVPETPLGRLTLVEWPLLGRPLWPLEAGTRHLADRARDAFAARVR